MRRLRPFVAAVVLIAGACTGSVASEQLVADIAERVGGGVWAVTADGCGWRTTGSAFAIDQRHLVTNRHVIANDSTPTIRSRDGEERSGKVSGSEDHPDIAVIEVDRDLPLTLPWAPTEALTAKEPLVAIGYPEPTNAFTASSGQILSFQGPQGTREAALANTPINHGSSGGPGVRANASVAGVVTLMLLREGSPDRVAILFTSHTVRPVIEGFIRQPRYVRSTCGLGPDYIPPVPKTYDIPEAPPTAEPLAPLPAPKAQPAQAAEATRDPLADYPQWTEPPPPPCPDGNVVTQVDEVTATEKQDDPGRWVVHVKGRVLNRSTNEIYIHEVKVRVEGDPGAEGSPVPDPRNVQADSSALWEFGDAEVYSPGSQPTRDSVTVVLDWRWTGQQISCPTTPPATATPQQS